MDMWYALEIRTGRSEYWSGCLREGKERKSRNEVGKKSEKGVKAEKSNTLRHSKPANIAESDWEHWKTVIDMIHYEGPEGE